MQGLPFSARASHVSSPGFFNIFRGGVPSQKARPSLEHSLWVVAAGGEQCSRGVFDQPETSNAQMFTILFPSMLWCFFFPKMLCLICCFCLSIWLSCLTVFFICLHKAELPSSSLHTRLAAKCIFFLFLTFWYMYLCISQVQADILSGALFPFWLYGTLQMVLPFQWGCCFNPPFLSSLHSFFILPSTCIFLTIKQDSLVYATPWMQSQIWCFGLVQKKHPNHRRALEIWTREREKKKVSQKILEIVEKSLIFICLFLVRKEAYLTM